MSKVLVGYVIRAHGIDGELKVIPNTDTPEDFCKIPKFLINDIAYVNKSSRIAQDYILLRLEGVTDRNIAELIRGEIFADRQSLPVLVDKYYIVDLIGSEIISGTNKLGVLRDVLKVSSVDTYVVSCDNNSFSFPALIEVIERIDINNKQIFINEEELKKVIVYEI